ncbi:MAG: inositol 2-dehydrogenase [Geminicoccaceae bacterium]|nr:inositol 2-dehydrogenase [Geminicoccaceae bacterium]MCX8101761.1 inositol 2-dehydrogenase [Geminicoccaceae bacterium]MDW8370661.1 inositol 2-dehydrogenase [Geminicoccaceae bacterium]
MLQVALLGCGRIGRMHAEFVHAHRRARLAWAFDVHRPAAEAVAAATGARVAKEVDEVLADQAVGAALIATSTDTHVDLITRCARAGKAVFCEKPIDLDIRKVDACWAAVGNLGVPIQIGFNRRFDPSFASLARRCREGEIGEIRQVLITSRDPDIPSDDYMKVAGGLLRDMTIHDLDMARFLLPEEPVAVFATAAALIDERVRRLGEHDTAVVVLTTESGKQAVITNYRRAVYGYDQRIEVVGEKGMLKAENRHPTTVELWTAERTRARDPVLHFFIERYREAYAAELDAFVGAVLDGEPVPVSFADGRAALRLADAAYQSLATGRMVRLD